MKQFYSRLSLKSALKSFCEWLLSITLGGRWAFYKWTNIEWAGRPARPQANDSMAQRRVHYAFLRFPNTQPVVRSLCSVDPAPVSPEQRHHYESHPGSMLPGLQVKFYYTDGLNNGSRAAQSHGPHLPFKKPSPVLSLWSWPSDSENAFWDRESPIFSCQSSWADICGCTRSRGPTSSHPKWSSISSGPSARTSEPQLGNFKGRGRDRRARALPTLPGNPGTRVKSWKLKLASGFSNFLVTRIPGPLVSTQTLRCLPWRFCCCPGMGRRALQWAQALRPFYSPEKFGK